MNDKHTVDAVAGTSSPGKPVNDPCSVNKLSLEVDLITNLVDAKQRDGRGIGWWRWGVCVSVKCFPSAWGRAARCRCCCAQQAERRWAEQIWSCQALPPLPSWSRLRVKDEKFAEVEGGGRGGRGDVREKSWG